MIMERRLVEVAVYRAQIGKIRPAARQGKQPGPSRRVAGSGAERSRHNGSDQSHLVCLPHILAPQAIKVSSL